MDLNFAGAIGLFVLGALIGRGWEKWASGTMDIEMAAFDAGWKAGTGKWPHQGRGG